ncbi:UTP--GlnB (protein PII) uridylyltransferase, GlnD [Granulicella pectinivorans]|jgi:[protein-PII] uridylyltransferase|uniref:Bifunctional uridylyltransferase/uridylyl-removing enzyme n=1 Tax=Granulicella pectinivorans TaxID=474950 RepID=A0A1I6M3L9_9BACT|nr:[protein-PII] uridylyltransferase [Granulicella pectinivorans]SFS10238.1 UTP--GlnB (protein PII) uridylyltransferase, GlnD [Granulicella pectinivorans]
MTEEGDSALAAREEYREKMLGLRVSFEAAAGGTDAGAAAILARSAAMDSLVAALWSAESAGNQRLRDNVSVIAVGGYGRRELFPSSDVDLLFLLDTKFAESEAKDSIRRVSQSLWDAGVRASPVTRGLTEADKLDPENVESALALLDARRVCGDAGLFARMQMLASERLGGKDGKTIMTKLAELVRSRYAKYGGTLFHLEPNIKDCPGGLRDVHVCQWIGRLLEMGKKKGVVLAPGDDGEFREAFEFLATVRCFLHYRRERDDNTLDWQAQDEAAARGIGIGPHGRRGDASYWMRIYFRHARIVNRRAVQALSEIPLPRKLKLPMLRRVGAIAAQGFRVEQGRATLDPAVPGQEDPAHEPHVVLHLFVDMARDGFVLSRETEDRLSNALPLISAHLEEGPALWHRLREVLKGPFAGDALRAMHAMGLLELLIPEFHGIDALVVRDAYHRYTVDEHTFVAIDTLHSLRRPQAGAAGEWAAKFARLLEDLIHPELLFLATLLHDTGKGHSGEQHAVESERMTRSVVERLQLESHEQDLVKALVRQHLEMSAALRRDIFDMETVRAFGSRVGTIEALRMLTLFTYADINAVHPDALTPWKAENLWRLYVATSNYLDRSVDDDRVSARAGSELVHRVVAFAPGRKAEVEAYLEGFPERYLRTRSSEQIRRQFEMSMRFAEDPVQLDFSYAPEASEITLVTRDRELLFATMAGVLAAWGMNIVTADAFSNAQGVVVDSFRFTDSFKTLEMNESERGRFVASAHDVLTGKQTVDKMLASRKRAKRKAPKVTVETRIDFDQEASSQSTLVQVVAQDTPGLLRALSLTLASHGCNVEVALVDTEGEMAIDVFYLTREGAKLDEAMQIQLRLDLLEAMDENAR